MSGFMPDINEFLFYNEEWRIPDNLFANLFYLYQMRGFEIYARRVDEISLPCPLVSLELVCQR